MQKLVKNAKLLQIFLILIGIHSFCVGVGLIVLSPEIMEIFGFSIHERFFAAQGGIFHIVMSIAYVMASRNIDRYPGLIHLSVIAKCVATLFLTIYYFVVNDILVVLLSGLGDFLMGIILIYLYRSHRKYSTENNQ